MLIHVAIPSYELDKSLNFYRDVIGATPFRILDDRVTFGFHWIFSFSIPKMAPLCTAKLSKNRPTRVLPACAIFFWNGLLVSAQKIRLRAA